MGCNWIHVYVALFHCFEKNDMKFATFSGTWFHLFCHFLARFQQNDLCQWKLYSIFQYILVCHWCFNDTTAKLGVIWRREKLERMELMWRGYIWPPQHLLWCCSPAWWLSWQPNTPWEASIFDIKTTCLNQRKLMWLQLNMLELIHLH